MATRFPSALPRRPTSTLHYLQTTTTTTTTTTATTPLSHTPLSRTPSRAATLIRRPRRPYAFTQLVQQSDGSTYTARTASPLGLYRSTKDARNHALWNPSDKSLQNVEVDEAGKLAAFRGRFGRGWDSDESSPSSSSSSDSDATTAGDAGAAAGSGKNDSSGSGGGSGDAFADLIAGYAVGMAEPSTPSAAPRKKK
ncbi:putative 50S ribosomal protein [Rosellinia necatrix]|uniref:Putative 50S ribosomal protein n=1 Tax=Rosellinia necatrix TaxID=77044 RepID=A0A1W2TVH1_ROSNE|nr:putative 50S ribosomal protein [Rosellinia necatrix]